MTLLLAKLVLTPLLIAAVTLAGRRWGPGVGGWLAGLPLTSGPVSVFLLTATAAALGPTVSGVLSPFPVFATVLAVFTHRHVGAAATQQLLRGIVLGSFAFAGFFVVVATALERWEAAATYVVACASALVINVALRPFLASGRSQ